MNTSRWILPAIAAGALALALASSCTLVPPTPPPAAEPGIELPPRTEWTATASAVQEDIYAASNAIDGNLKTRWSSPASDPQWIQIDLGRPATVCGLTIQWEDAFSSQYAILVSESGNEWTEVYSALKGDGKTDEVYFAPVKARFVRLLGTKRGTGWGHSIWEIQIKGAGDRIRVEQSGRPAAGGEALFDGRPESGWTGKTKGTDSITIDLGKIKPLGGVRIDWGSNYAETAALFESRDGTNWTARGEIRDGVGDFDLILHPKGSARYLRLDLSDPAHPDAPFDIKEITLKGPDEVMTPLAMYEIAANKARLGLYPEQFLKRQVYWTVVGLPDDRQESLLDEYGNLEPVAAGCSIMPYLYVDETLVAAADAKRVSQFLENGYLPLPSVEWDADALRLKVEAITCGTTEDSVTYARYTISNVSKGPRAGKLFLAIRPVQINPTWQYGGLSNIRSMEYTNAADGAVVRVNGIDQFVLLNPPDGFGARAFDQGDIARSLVRGKLPPPQQLDHMGDLISGALAYEFDLAPGKSRTVVIAAPLHRKHDQIAAFLKKNGHSTYEPGEAFSVRLEEMRKFWTEQIDKVDLDLPDADLGNTLRSQIGYILINRDGPAIQPGSRNYKRSWMRDGAFTTAGMLRMGLVDPVREYLDWYAERVQPDGLVPPILNNDGSINGGFGSNLEYDGQGEFVMAIMEFYRLTGDRAFLEKHFDRIHLALQYLVTLREKTLAPDYMKDEPGRERFVGILPPSLTHEGYPTPVHSYWDDFFALKGWKDGRDAALALGRTNEAQWAEEQYQLLRASVKASIEKTIEFKNIDFIPGCAEKGDPDASSTSIALFPCNEQDILPEAPLQKTFDDYWQYINDRLKPDFSAGFSPYELRNVMCFVMLGQKDRATFLLDYMMGCRRPLAWNHLAEVVLSDPRMGTYIGDMPHTWIGSSLINAVRGMLIEEIDGKLVLLAGAPEKWVREGAGIRLEQMPTYFGRLGLTAKMSGNTLTVKLGGELNPPKGLELRWPRDARAKPANVIVDGYKWTDFDDTRCRLPAMARDVVAEWPSRGSDQ